MSGTLRLRGATSGYSELQAPAVAADQTFVLPTAGGTLLTTDSPVSKLTLELGSASQPSLTFEGDTDTGLYSSGTNTLNLVTGGSNRLVIDSSGNVGIADNGPNFKLDVNGDIGIREGNNLVFHDGGGTPAFRIRGDSANKLHFERASNNAAQMIIDNGNVGIGTASPGDYLASAHQLVISDAASTGLTIATPTSSSGTIAFADGTGAADNARGLIRYGHSDNSLQFSTNASERMRIDSSGRLLLNSGTDVRIELGTTGTTGTNDRNHLRGDGANLKYNTASGGVHVFEQNGTERLRIDSSGNLGIGTTSPSSKLHIAGSDDNFITLSHPSRTGTWFIEHSGTYSENLVFQQNNGVSTANSYLAGRDLHVFYTNTSERMRIDSSGYVGIGTSSPSAHLHIAGSQQFSWGEQRIGHIFDNTYRSGIAFSASGRTLRLFSTTNDVGGSISFLTRVGAGSSDTDYGTERVRIDSNGRLLVGTTTVRTGNIHHIESTSSDTTLLVTKNSGTATHIPLAVYHTATSGDNSLINFYTDGGNFRGSIGYNRTTNKVSYNETSDIRLKQNIVDAPSAINLVSQIRVRSFDWIEEGHDTVNYGYVAQELNEVFPTAVSVGDSGDEVEQTWGVSNASLVPVLTKALQEAMERIESLETRIATLENN